MMYKLDQLIAWVDLSTYCNAACPLCHRTNPKTLEKADWLPLVQWSLEQFQQVFPVSSMHQYKQFQICGTWGDPMMNKDVLEIVQYIIDNSDCFISIDTNGSMRDPDWWWKLGAVGGQRLSVTFAVEGITQQMHSQYRQNTNLDKLLNNIEAYCSTKARARAKVLIFKHNQDYLQQIEQMLRARGLKQKVMFQQADRFDTGPTFSFGNGLQLEQCL